jgi:hypothetical protein
MGKRKSVSDIYFNNKMTVDLVQANASDKIVASGRVAP